MDNYQLAIIGAGPGGYVAAIRAAQLGLKTVLIEKDSSLGGTCLNIGCIPSKALLESSEHYAAALHQFPKHGIQVGEVTLNLMQMMKRKAEIVKTPTDGVAMLLKKNKVTVIKGYGKLLGSGRIRVETDPPLSPPAEQGGQVSAVESSPPFSPPAKRGGVG
ncbi:MAG: FAD-dependent oxidoreductase, partial [Calditrichota bacterium]